MVALYPHLACVCMWVSLLSLFGLCMRLQLHIPLLSISSRAPALASWRTAARVQVARIHECIALHWDLHPLPCLPARLLATPIQLQLCHPQNLQQMHPAVVHPNCGNLAEGKAVWWRKVAGHFGGGERCWDRHWTLTSRQLARNIRS